MSKLQVVIKPGASRTRVLAAEAGEAVLKARLLPSPAHPRAMQWLLEAVALWQGQHVDAALCAGGRDRWSLSLFEADWFADFGGALYTLQLLESEGVRRGGLKDELSGMGDCRELKQLVRAMRDGRVRRHSG
ncbi:MAG: hypothetical protein GWO02_10670 [Gammaproteobacteria bacterium]|nr:hypothetical protein [Gammaproteobacteria bacterium]